MTRLTPAETAAWDAEIDARRSLTITMRCDVRGFNSAIRQAMIATGQPLRSRPYSRLRERDIFDEAHTPRHAKRSHRAEVAA